MEHINVGASIDGERPESKAALKRALADTPGKVWFDATTAIGPRVGARFNALDIPEGVVLNVTGPNPYTSRRWYGNATRGEDGRPRLA